MSGALERVSDIIARYKRLSVHLAAHSSREAATIERIAAAWTAEIGQKRLFDRTPERRQQHAVLEDGTRELGP